MLGRSKWITTDTRIILLTARLPSLTLLLALQLQWIEDIKHVCNLNSFEYPLFCDPTRETAVKLGILDASNKDANGLPLTVRSVYILKPDKTVALMMTYPASTGRNFDEILRCIDSLQLTANQSLATPVVSIDNRKEGKHGSNICVNAHNPTIFCLTPIVCT